VQFRSFLGKEAKLDFLFNVRARAVDVSEREITVIIFRSSDLLMQDPKPAKPKKEKEDETH